MIKSLSAPDIRERNHRVVFELARRQGELLRPDISRVTGMTPPTVMKVVQSLLERGILIEAGEAETAVGRKPKRLVFQADSAVAVGVLFEGAEMQIGLVNLSGTVLRNIGIPMKHAFDESILPVMVDSIRELTKDIQVPVLGLGLGLPGVVDSARSIIEFAPLIGIVSPMDCSGLCRSMQQQTGLPVCMENDVNAAAIGEYMYRRMPGDADLLYVAIGTGIGAGIVLNGELRRGSRNLAGELGYAVQNASYLVDRTRPGWLESQIGLDSLQRQFNWQGYGSDDSVPDGLVDVLVDHLAPVVANLATQLDIQTVVLGGRAIHCLGDALFHKLADKIGRLSLESGSIEPPRCADPGVAGAAMISINNQLDGWLAEREPGV